jgi:hypothetical protein
MNQRPTGWRVTLRAAPHPHHLSTFLRAALREISRRLLATYLMPLSVLVHCCGPAIAEPATTPPTSASRPVAKAGAAKSWPVTTPLPPAAADMHEAILSAVHSGQIDDLKLAYDLGELRADLGEKTVSDPVAHWKSLSADGEGREVLAIVADLFAVGPAVVHRGQDPENNAVYVWPYLAELPLDTLTPAQEVDLLRLVSATEAKAMRRGKTYTGWRLTIGADGLWHAFHRGR